VVVGTRKIHTLYTYIHAYCPAKAKDLNSLECETEKNDFKVSVLSRQKYYR